MFSTSVRCSLFNSGILLLVTKQLHQIFNPKYLSGIQMLKWMYKSGPFWWFCLYVLLWFSMAHIDWIANSISQCLPSDHQTNQEVYLHWFSSHKESISLILVDKDLQPPTGCQQYLYVSLIILRRAHKVNKLKYIIVVFKGERATFSSNTCYVLTTTSKYI